MKKQRSNTVAVVQQGFTLIELLVVVAVLATMAGIAASVVGNYDQQAREQLVHTEMKNIAKAIYRFKQDTGYFPKEGVFSGVDTLAESSGDQLADLGFLFTPPTKSASLIAPWNEMVGIGWNGPYMTTDSQQKLHTLDTSSKSYCDEELITTPFILSNSVLAISDTFDSSSTYVNTESCFVVHANGGWVPNTITGKPYRYLLGFSNSDYPDCTGGFDCIALHSAGKNGVYENGNSDDVVKVLRVNR